MIYAVGKGIGVASNTYGETLAIKEAFKFFLCYNSKKMMIKIDFLALKKMIKRQWKVPWKLIELIEDIRVKLHSMQGKLIHIFREGNTAADALANEVIDSQEKKEYHRFNQLPANIRKCINIDKAQIPNLRIRMRK